jgi:hypothetical protein
MMYSDEWRETDLVHGSFHISPPTCGSLTANLLFPSYLKRRERGTFKTMYLSRCAFIAHCLEGGVSHTASSDPIQVRLTRRQNESKHVQPKHNTPIHGGVVTLQPAGRTVNVCVARHQLRSEGETQQVAERWVWHVVWWTWDAMWRVCASEHSVND